MQTVDMTYDQLDAAISQYAGRTLTPNDAFELCEAQGFCAITNPNKEDGQSSYVCTFEGGQTIENSPVLAIKRAFVLKNIGPSVG
jgi:putative hemolysin